MQLLGLILLIGTSWYIWKLSSNFFDDETKKEINDNYSIFKKQFDELKKRFSQENLNKVWENYKKDISSEKKDK
tara:strand:+ start:1225 stop:1446 length:222 start_codon:yes stop_codon:yes gene_type:complete